ncbi:MAG: LpxD N-terminal domain-containing protein, partial [Methanocella sp.]
MVEGKAWTARELATLVGGEVLGDPERVVGAAAGLEEAGPADVTFADAGRTAEALAGTAGVVLLARPQGAAPEDLRGWERPDQTLILVDNPRLAFARVLLEFGPDYRPRPGVHPQAVVHATAVLGSEVAIGPGAVVEAGVRLGDRVILYPGVYVGPDSAIGDGSVLHARVV